MLGITGTALILCIAHITQGVPFSSNWAQYYPLAEGNAWVYRSTEEGKESTTVEWRVTQVMRKPEGDIYVLWPTPPIDDESKMLLLAKDGLREWDFDDGLGFYVLRFPTREGDSWREEYHSYRKNRTVSREARILSLGKPCRSGEHTFSDCVTVQEDNEDFSLRIIEVYARNVGPVKYEYYRIKDSKPDIRPFALLELVSYKLSYPKQHER